MVAFPVDAFIAHFRKTRFRIIPLLCMGTGRCAARERTGSEIDHGLVGGRRPALIHRPPADRDPLLFTGSSQQETCSSLSINTALCFDVKNLKFKFKRAVAEYVCGAGGCGAPPARAALRKRRLGLQLSRWRRGPRWLSEFKLIGRLTRK